MDGISFPRRVEQGHPDGDEPVRDVDGQRGVIKQQGAGKTPPPVHKKRLRGVPWENHYPT